jgi:hypothetical protein
MNRLEKIRCGECGRKDVTEQNVRDRWGMPWRDFPFVKVESDLVLPMCSHCGNVIIPASAVDTIDNALQNAIQNLTKTLLSEIKKKHGLKLVNIAKLTGVTPEYLSMLLNKKKVPSFQLIQLLTILRLHPEMVPELSTPWHLEMPTKNLA